LEKTSKITKSNRHPNTTMPAKPRPDEGAALTAFTSLKTMPFLRPSHEVISLTFVLPSAPAINVHAASPFKQVLFSKKFYNRRT